MTQDVTVTVPVFTEEAPQDTSLTLIFNENHAIKELIKGMEMYNIRDGVAVIRRRDDGFMVDFRSILTTDDAWKKRQ
jgi:hypothetical protein